MDTLLDYYFEIFDAEIESSGGKLTSEIQSKINETRERLKDTFEFWSSPIYTRVCLYIDKKIDEYIIERQS